MTIYEIDQIMRNVIENGFHVDEETGELLFTDADLETLNVAREKKIESAALILKEEQAFAEAIQKEITELLYRQRTADGKVKRLKEYLQNALAGEKFETPLCKISYRKSTKVEVDDIDHLPDDFVKREMIMSPNRAAIKDALKSGQPVDGARLVETMNIQVK